MTAAITRYISGALDTGKSLKNFQLMRTSVFLADLLYVCIHDKQFANVLLLI